MASHAPIAVGEQTAAKMLDMPVAQFRQLVSEGLLPRGRMIAPGFQRWDVETLRQVARGDAVDERIAW